MALKRRNIIPAGLGLGLTLLVMVLYVVGTSFTDLMELKALDAMFLFRGQVPMVTDKVVVVAVDERSLDEAGRWPWPREKMAALIKAVSDQGAKAIGLDIGFFEPDNRFDAQTILAINRAAEAGKPLSLEEIVARFHPDYVLAQTIASIPAEVVLGYFFHMSKEAVSHLKAEEIKARRRAIDRFAFPAVRYRSEAAMERPLVTAYAPENNQPVLIQAARAAGYFNIIPDGDGVARRINLVIQCGDRLYPAMSLVTLSRFWGVPLPVVDVKDFGLESLTLGPVRIPVDEKGRAWINFRGGRGAVPRYEAVDVLRGKLPKGALKDKAVILGVSATGVGDVRATPFETTHPGVEIQAQVVDNILSGQFLFRPSWARLFDLIAILGLGLIAAFVMSALRPSRGWWVVAVLGVGFVILGYQLFLQGYLLNLTHPLLALVVSAVGLTAYRYLTEEREKKYIRHAFQHYLNPSVIEQVVSHPEGLKLGGQKRVLTVLFSDIRGFTSISEKLEPEVLSHALNTYLDRMTEVVFEHDGVLDKYIGDAVMAFFGAPMDQPDHAARACRTALRMVEELKKLGAFFDEMGVPHWQIGIGINTGPMVVGNLGSRLRFDYTVIGDNVNTASRLEGQTKGYGVGIIVGQATVEECRDRFHFRILDLIRVKGKTEPVAIYELVGPAEEPKPEIVDLAETAFKTYLDRDFALAEALLEQILSVDPGDAPAALLKARCRELIANPPPEDWDGVETKTTK